MDVKLEAYLQVIIFVTNDQWSDTIGLSRDIYLLHWGSSGFPPGLCPHLAAKTETYTHIHRVHLSVLQGCWALP